MRYSQLIAPRTSEVVEARTPRSGARRGPGAGAGLRRLCLRAASLGRWAAGLSAPLRSRADGGGRRGRSGRDPRSARATGSPDSSTRRYADLVPGDGGRAAAGPRRRRRRERPRRTARLPGQRPAPHPGRAGRSGRGHRPGLHGTGHAATAQAARPEPDRRHRRARGRARGGNSDSAPTSLRPVRASRRSSPDPVRRLAERPRVRRRRRRVRHAGRVDAGRRDGPRPRRAFDPGLPPGRAAPGRRRACGTGRRSTSSTPTCAAAPT